MGDFFGKIKIIVLLVVVIQLTSTSCSKKLYKAPTPQKKESREDIKVSETKKLTSPHR